MLKWLLISTSLVLNAILLIPVLLAILVFIAASMSGCAYQPPDMPAKDWAKVSYLLRGAK